MARRQHSLKDVSVTITRKDGRSDQPIGTLLVTDLEAEVDPASIAAIEQDIDGLHRNIGNENIVRGIGSEKIKQVLSRSVVIGTDEVTIAHGFGYAPNFYHVIHKSSVVPYQSREPDSNNIYLIATAAVTADVKIEG